MVFSGRPHRDLGKKLLASGVIPLDGQLIAADDSLLVDLRDASGRGLDASYGDLIEEIFDERFWNGPDVCTEGSGTNFAEQACDGTEAHRYTLKEWNYALFFGLAVQAYEATLTTEQTIVDLLVGGVATGLVTNRTAKAQRDRAGG